MWIQKTKIIKQSPLPQSQAELDILETKHESVLEDD